MKYNRLLTSMVLDQENNGSRETVPSLKLLGRWHSEYLPQKMLAYCGKHNRCYGQILFP